MDLASQPETKPEKSEKSYLSALESISPWSNSRTSSPKPPLSAGLPGEGSGLKNQHAGDLASNHWYGLSQRRYPSDCPPLNARWFYAVDVPKRKPKLLKTEERKPTKPLAAPKKFVTFSTDDSQSIEAAYQRLADSYDQDNRDANHKAGEGFGEGKLPRDSGKAGNTSIEEAGHNENAGGNIRVPVQEDYLFDVDLEKRELCPVYWLGPIYEVRRGSWFYQEGSGLRPCEENLAAQLEEGFLKIKPWRYPKAPEKSFSRPSSIKPGDSLALSGAFRNRNRGSSSSTEVTPKNSVENLRAANQQALNDAAQGSKDAPIPPPHQPETYRLFGTYMNSIVTYQDSTVAWLSEDSIMSRVSSNIYQKFAGGGYLGGVKIIRGYTEPGKAKDSTAADERPRTPSSASSVSGNITSLQVDERQQRLLKRRSAPPTTANREVTGTTVEDQLSTLANDRNPDIEEAVRKRDEKEIQSDYNEEGEQSREVEHLILVTHGIGQRLGLRTESVNFVHDVNVFRQTLKSVYNNSVDMQALNSEVDKLPKNCRVQVLPVCWRHLLDFPRKGVRQTRKEHDLGDAFADEEEYPSLEDITIDGVPFVRSLISDLALDILLYQSAYRDHIASIVLEESNRIYKLFCDRNPKFASKGGKVTLVGHSLGSAIFMDLLCRQREASKQHVNHRRSGASKAQGGLSFLFDVPAFFCLGSPIGLFQMLKGRTIAARHHVESRPAESPMNPDYMDDPFLSSTGENVSSTTGLPYSVSSPKCGQLYNIFYPSDPISYRLEPLVSSVYGGMKPQPLPYTKSNFGTAASQGLTGIGAKVGQSVSGLWSSLSSGIASSLLNRSLGLTPADIASMGAPSQSSQSSQSIGAGTNISAGGVITDIPALVRENTNEKMRQLAEDTAAADRDGKGSAPTLIDNEIETLYAGFEKGRKSQQNDQGGNDPNWATTEERGKKLRREEMKVRALNHTGRIDFQIQESVLDFNPMSTITSHLSYWADEDVAHFILSQLLSRNRNPRPEQSTRK